MKNRIGATVKGIIAPALLMAMLLVGSVPTDARAQLLDGRGLDPTGTYTIIEALVDFRVQVMDVSEDRATGRITFTGFTSDGRTIEGGGVARAQLADNGAGGLAVDTSVPAELLATVITSAGASEAQMKAIGTLSIGDIRDGTSNTFRVEGQGTLNIAVGPGIFRFRP